MRRDTIYQNEVMDVARTETLRVRIEPELKIRVEETLRNLGLSTSEAIHIFLHQIPLCGGLPFAVRTPQYSAETLAAMQEARDIASGKISAKSFHSVDELMKDLNDDADD